MFIAIQIGICVAFAMLGAASNNEPIYWWVSGVAAGVAYVMLDTSLRAARDGR